MSRKTLNIGLYGFGCVGFGLYEVLQKTPGLKANIKNICVKDKNKPREIGLENFTFDKNDILNDNEINVVVELIDDADAAYQIVKTALQKGKAVVTANKKMLAESAELPHYPSPRAPNPRTASPRTAAPVQSTPGDAPVLYTV